MKMPRAARIKSENNTYHIIMRGINRQQIFEDEQDNEKFLEILEECRAISGYKIFAYCLMGNHFHLLVKFEEEPIEQAMKRICGRFVYWYNTKYGRVGHLFQDRFKSEPINDDKYFLSCIRYIHQNPQKAGICDIDKYEYSSYHTYLNRDEKGLVDISMLYSVIKPEQFLEYSRQTENGAFLEIYEIHKQKITDEEARQVIYRICKCNNVSEFQAIPPDRRGGYLNLMKIKGLGIRQICRLTGESYYSVQKVNQP